MRSLNLPLITLLLLTSITAHGYEWEPAGMAGINATCIEFDDEHDRLLVGTQEGFHIYDLVAGTWSEFDDEGWIGRQVHTILADPYAADRILTGRENAFWKGYLELSEDGGASGEVVHMSQGGAFWDLEYDWQYFYACGISDITPGELLRSPDGLEWTTLTGHGHTAMTALGVGMSEEVFVAGDDQVWVTQDQGQTWTDLGDDLGPQLVRCLYAHWPSGDVVYTECLAGGDDGLWRTLQPYDEWHQVLSGETCRAVTAMYAPAPWPLNRYSRTVVVTGDGRVLVADLGCTGWEDETGDLPAAAIDAVFSLPDRSLYVTTASAGVFRVQPVIAAIDELPSIAEPTLAAWPNPFNPRATLSWEMPREATGRLAVYDVTGRKVAVLAEGSFAAGSHSTSWDAGDQASGVYLARLETELGFATSRLVLVR